jgi:hypothetical protein
MQLKAVFAIICMTTPQFLLSMVLESPVGHDVEKKNLIAPVRNRTLVQQSAACYFFELTVVNHEEIIQNYLLYRYFTCLLRIFVVKFF